MDCSNFKAGDIVARRKTHSSLTVVSGASSSNHVLYCYVANPTSTRELDFIHIDNALKIDITSKAPS